MPSRNVRVKTVKKLKTLARELSSFLAAAALSASALGQENSRVDLQIEAQSLDAALKEFAKQAGKQIVFYSDDAKSLTVEGIEGNYSEAEALQRLLGSSDLLYIYLNDRTIAVGNSDRITSKAGQTGTGTPAAQPEDLGDQEDTQATDEEEEAIEEIVIIGRSYDQELSIAAKRNARQVVDVLSADQASRLPDNNIAESLGRIAGISFQRSGETGNGDFISIRGLDSGLNNFQFDGVNSGLASSGSRRVPLDGITADDVAELRVVKSLLPQDEGEGIGGSIQITSRTPLERGKDRLTFGLEGRYGEFADELGSRANLAATKIFNEDFGVNLSVSYRKRFIQNFEIDASSSNLLFVPPLTDADGNPVSTDFIEDRLDDPANDFDNLPEGFIPRSAMTFEEQTYEIQQQERETISVSGAVDWQISPTTRLTLGGRYSRQESIATENSLAFDNDDDDFELIDGTLFTIFDDPEIDLESQIEDEKNINANMFLKGETNLERLTLKYQASFALARENAPQTDIDFDTGNLLNEDTVKFVPFAFTDEFFPIPNASVLDDAEFVNAIADFEGTQELDDFTVVSRDERENKRYALKLDADYELNVDFANGVLNSVSAGVKFERSEIDEEEITLVDLEAGALNLDGTFNPDNDGTADGELLSQFPGLFGRRESLSDIGSPLSSIGIDSLPTLNERALRQIIRTFKDSFAASGATPEEVDFFIGEESFYAAYVQADVEFFERLRLVGGVRVEYYEGDFETPLDVNIRINTTNLTDPTDEDSDVDRQIDLSTTGRSAAIEKGANNFEVLPRLNAIFHVNDEFQIRGGIGYSIARPTFSQLGNSTRVDVILDAEADSVGDTPVLPGIDNAADAIAAGGISLDQLTEAAIFIRNGNPDLDNAKSLNLDLSFEYFPAKGTSLTAGIFYKRINDFIFFNANSGSSFDPAVVAEQLTADGQTLINQLGGLDGIINSDILDDITISQPRNGDTAEILGIEIGFNHKFSWAEGFLSNFGLSANVTYTDSKAEFNVVDPATDNPAGGLRENDALVALGFAEVGDGLVRETSFLNSPDWSANSIFYYDGKNFEMALSVRYQSEAFDVADDFGFDQYSASYVQVDFDAEYRLPIPSQYGRFSIYLEIPDITDDGTNHTDLQTLGRKRDLFDEASFNGREFRFGLRGRF